MEYELFVDGTTNDVNLVVHQQLDSARYIELLELTAIRLGSESSKKLLVLHAAGPPVASFMESYNCAVQMPTLLPKGTRVANIFPEANLDDARFLDTVAMNRGLTMQSFANKNDALKWLHK